MHHLGKCFHAIFDSRINASLAGCPPYAGVDAGFGQAPMLTYVPALCVFPGSKILIVLALRQAINQMLGLTCAHCASNWEPTLLAHAPKADTVLLLFCLWLAHTAHTDSKCASCNLHACLAAAAACSNKLDQSVYLQLLLAICALLFCATPKAMPGQGQRCADGSQQGRLCLCSRS